MTETDVADWLAEIERDHREEDCSWQALVVLGLAAALRADSGQALPGVCAAFAQLRESRKRREQLTDRGQLQRHPLTRSFEVWLSL